MLKYTGLDPAEARDKATEALTEVGLGHRLNQRPSELSGGEKQRVAIARALAKAPQLLFADEPTSALDGENGQVVIRLLRRAAKEHGAAVICVTHDPRLEVYADRVIHIEDGHILDDHRRDAQEPGASPRPMRPLPAANPPPPESLEFASMLSFLRRRWMWVALVAIVLVSGAPSSARRPRPRS